MVTPPKYVVVDLYEVIAEYSAYSSLYVLYVKFPLSEIIRAILHATAYQNDEYVWYEVEQRFDYEDIDVATVQWFFEILTWSLDERIRRAMPTYLDSGEYVFNEWVDNYTVVLCRV